jgi:hypothetical protein
LREQHPTDALREYQAAADIMGALVKKDPTNTAWQQESATYHHKVDSILKT